MTAKIIDDPEKQQRIVDYCKSIEELERRYRRLKKLNEVRIQRERKKKSAELDEAVAQLDKELFSYAKKALQSSVANKNWLKCLLDVIGGCRHCKEAKRLPCEYNGKLVCTKEDCPDWPYLREICRVVYTKEPQDPSPSNWYAKIFEEEAEIQTMYR